MIAAQVADPLVEASHQPASFAPAVRAPHPARNFSLGRPQPALGSAPGPRPGQPFPGGEGGERTNPKFLGDGEFV